MTVKDDQMVDPSVICLHMRGYFRLQRAGRHCLHFDIVRFTSSRADERVVLLNTGSGMKYLDVLGPGFGL
ncbi:MAG: hypothetical protein Ct9H300mP19_04810 [Dehalococcoidia bacterium]|nr:MAG: hypothetical protein Ct9H300mP19_04810 [Dehalococcoidia bacterium]